MDRELEKCLEKLNPFEISHDLIQEATLQKLYDAGRGNPNWINTLARQAFALLMQFGCQDVKMLTSDQQVASVPENQGIASRLQIFLDEVSSDASDFLKKILDFSDKQNWIADKFVSELVHGVLGDNYPTPPRVLSFVERVLNLYFEEILYGGRGLYNDSQIFATEGGTAAICYIFSSLKENFLIQKGQKIAMNTPIFTPYLDIPTLNDYELVEVCVESSDENDWQVSLEGLDLLKNPAIKVFFLVNPSNPGSVAMSKKLLDKLEEIVIENPDLMIVTDDVYATFVEDFESVYARLPKSTILVYSFSKLFGATGWRVGDIVVNKDNIFDKKIAQLSSDQKTVLQKRYQKVSTDVTNLSFIDRLVADSRAVGLAHTAGVSTPAQIMEMLFAFVLLLDKDKQYSHDCSLLVQNRARLFYEALGLTMPKNPLSTYYYGLVNIRELAENKYGKEFVAFLESDYEEIDFAVRLAKDFGVVLLEGVGFGTQKGEMRVSFSNLQTQDYPTIANGILRVMEEYFREFQERSSLR